MTETNADWVERPRPADVAALTTRSVPPASRRRDRPVGQTPAIDARLVGALAAAVALTAALLLRRRQRR